MWQAFESVDDEDIQALWAVDRRELGYFFVGGQLIRVDAEREGEILAHDARTHKEEWLPAAIIKRDALDWEREKIMEEKMDIQEIIVNVVNAIRAGDMQMAKIWLEDMIVQKQKMANALSGEDYDPWAENALLDYKAEFDAAEQMLTALDEGYRLVEWRDFLDEAIEEVEQDLQETVEGKWYKYYVTLSREEIERAIEHDNDGNAIEFNGWIFYIQ